MKLSQIITVDTRPGWLSSQTSIGDHGNENLRGCKSADFLTDATVARNRFLESPLITERETILCVDLHETISGEVMRRLVAMKEAGEITKIVYREHRKGHRWNDRLYLEALRHATGDLVAKWDGDSIGYKADGFDFVGFALEQLNSGYAYVCQQTQVGPGIDPMWWASTRFFLTRRDTMDLDEAEKCLDDRYRAKQIPRRHLPCLEHILGAMCFDRVFYPVADYKKFTVWSWSSYHRGTIEKLNAMDYEDVRRIVVEEWGLHGAEDVVGKPL